MLRSGISENWCLWFRYPHTAMAMVGVRLSDQAGVFDCQYFFCRGNAGGHIQDLLRGDNESLSFVKLEKYNDLILPVLALLSTLSHSSLTFLSALFAGFIAIEISLYAVLCTPFQQY